MNGTYDRNVNQRIQKIQSLVRHCHNRCSSYDAASYGYVALNFEATASSVIPE